MSIFKNKNVNFFVLFNFNLIFFLLIFDYLSKGLRDLRIDPKIVTIVITIQTAEARYYHLRDIGNKRY